MIQRIQSVYLFLVEVIFITLFFLPSMGILYANTNIQGEKTILDMPFFLIAEGVLTLLAVFAITQFKNRPLQIKLCNGGVLLSLVILGLISIMPDLFSGAASISKDKVTTDFLPGFWLIFANPILFFVAGRAVKKDEELVRSADRLR
jgi:Domain of unknown function (DUF4293)